jgi:hypothetical protein
LSGIQSSVYVVPSGFVFFHSHLQVLHTVFLLFGFKDSELELVSYASFIKHANALLHASSFYKDIFSENVLYAVSSQPLVL